MPAYRADGHGRAAHDPAMMVALLLYAYAVGERSSRGIERRCVEDVAFRVMAANQAPDHATVARFRARPRAGAGRACSAVFALCARAADRGRRGRVWTGRGSNDASGRPTSATNSSRARSSRRRRVDRGEDERFGQARGDELPAELLPITREQRTGGRCSRRSKAREDRPPRRASSEAWSSQGRAHRARRAAGAGAAAAGAHPSKAAGRINMTDRDSRSMRTHRGFLQGYTAQAVATSRVRSSSPPTYRRRRRAGQRRR